MYQCHKYGFKLSTTEFNRVFRTASVIPAARKPFKIHYYWKFVWKFIYVKLTSYDITPNKINALEN